MKTISEIIHKKTLPLEIFDSNKNLIYYETPYDYWYKYEYDSNGSLIYYETLDRIELDNR